MTAGRLRIAMLAHSTNPRGSVVHALEVADGLADAGHDVVVHAPDPGGAGFFRETRCRTVALPAGPVAGGLFEMVEARSAEYVAYFSAPGAARFDLYHAQDGISGNALARLRELGAIPGFLRTVHHLDAFADVRLAARQMRAVITADRVLCVSRFWQEVLARDHGIAASPVGNGVDAARFSPAPHRADSELSARLGLGAGPVFLAVGGIEERKNTVRVLQAFAQLRTARPDAQLVVAGGASLLDHSATRAAFAAALRATGLDAGPGAAVVATGTLADKEMPPLYRLSDALVFPSLREGFGLVVLEAMASGTPVIVSRIAPFTEHLAADECLWVDPTSVGEISAAMLDAVDAATRHRLAAAGHSVCRRHTWQECARRHLEAYAHWFRSSRETAHA
ncbi:MAG TPA: MSMEG_0565 family glycosyltransferase [Stellaceae bacterium]|nr:MSMEG_0565 family glycosyltransferase [Stellaceae bacterium]